MRCQETAHSGWSHYPTNPGTGHERVGHVGRSRGKVTRECHEVRSRGEVTREGKEGRKRGAGRDPEALVILLVSDAAASDIDPA